MNLNKFTEKAQEAILEAQGLATQYNHSQIEPEHLLLSLLQQTDGVVPQIVQKLGDSPQALQQRLESGLAARPKVYGTTTQVGLSRALQEILQAAEREAGQMRDDYVSTEHLLITLTDSRAGQVAQILAAFGITRDAILRTLTAIRGSQRVTTPMPESTYQALDKYGRDLTQLARQGKVDPVIPAGAARPSGYEDFAGRGQRRRHGVGRLARRPTDFRVGRGVGEGSLICRCEEPFDRPVLSVVEGLRMNSATKQSQEAAYEIASLRSQ